MSQSPHSLVLLFRQVHFWEVLLDICVVVLVGKLLEPLWGAVEMLVFFMVVNVGVAMLAAFFYYLLYMVTFDTKLLFSVHIHGTVEHRKTHKESIRK